MNFIKLLKNSFLPLFLILIFLNGCSKDDDNDPEEEPVSEFYQNALTTAKSSELLGTWTIVSAEYAGEVVQVPINFDVCGRDYFTYLKTVIMKNIYILSLHAIPR